MLVDSSVWIDFLAARETRQTLFLRERLGRHPVISADLVVMEVLQGTRDDRAFERAKRLLLQLHAVTVSDPELAVEAASNYRSLRARGITIRKTVDTLIATRCILDGIPLLYSDRDFDPFVAHLGLRAALPTDTGVS